MRNSAQSTYNSPLEQPTLLIANPFYYHIGRDIQRSLETVEFFCFDFEVDNYIKKYATVINLSSGLCTWALSLSRYISILAPVLSEKLCMETQFLMFSPNYYVSLNCRRSVISKCFS